MTQEKRFAAPELLRVNMDVDTRDVTALWTETDEVVVRGSDVDAVVEAGELFLTSESSRRNNAGPIQVELPARPIGCEIKIQRGDVRLSNPQGRIDVQVDSGDVAVDSGSGSLSIACGKGDMKVDGYAGELTTNSGSGDKSLKNVDGAVTVRSGKGDVELAGGQGVTTVSVGSGDIRIHNRDCDDLTVAGAKGDVTISGGRLGRSTLTASSGDIRCQADLSVTSYAFTASSGDISISIPRGLAARVDAATTRGNVMTELPLVAINQRGPRNPLGKRLVGSTSDAPERADITLRTSSGDIMVNWASNIVPATDDVAARRDDRSTGVRRADPTAPVSGNPPDSAPSQSESLQAKTSVPAAPLRSSDDDRKRVILSALADGAISVTEASRLLDALDRSISDATGR